jgi:hypothetical protein
MFEFKFPTNNYDVNFDVDEEIYKHNANLKGYTLTTDPNEKSLYLIGGLNSQCNKPLENVTKLTLWLDMDKKL